MVMKFNTICRCGKLVVGSVTNCSCKKRKPKAEKDRNKELTTTKWSKFRKRIIERDSCHCQRCLVKYSLIETSNLQVHHIKPRIKYPNLMYKETNCVTLCKQCNLELGTQEEFDFEFVAEEIKYEYLL